MGNTTVRSNRTSTGPSITAEAFPILDLASSTLQSSLTPPVASPPSTDSPTPPVVEQVAASSQSAPEDCYDIFYDALDNLFGPDEQDLCQPTCTNRCADYDTASGGTSGSATDVRTAIAPDPTPLHGPPGPFFPATPSGPPRGVSPATVSPDTTPVGTRLADQVGHDFPPQPPAAGSVFREPVKKAVVVGINYAGADRLRHAVRDARRFAKALIKHGFLEGNIIVLTDESDQDQMCPTYSNLINWIQWLIRDAKAGDTLVFFFSGHGLNFTSTAWLVTADKKPFERYALHQHLVEPVPAECELQIILDCCSASAMIHLQYCVGRMEPFFIGQVPSVSESASPGSNIPTSPDLSPIQPAFPTRPAFGGSFYGIPLVNNNAESSSASTWPVTDLFVTPNNPAPPRRIGIVTAPPPSSSNDNATGTAAFGYLASLVGASQASISSAIPTQVATSERQRGRQPVAKGLRPPDHFEERKGDFVKPAGRVIFWASTGENQLAYEAYGSQIKDGVKIRVRNGIVAHAMCTVLDACISTTLTVRDIWNSLVGAIADENGWRDARDIKKVVRPDRRLRVQHAELWVSQPEPLLYAATVLDRPMF